MQFDALVTVIISMSALLVIGTDGCLSARRQPSETGDGPSLDSGIGDEEKEDAASEEKEDTAFASPPALPKYIYKGCYLDNKDVPDFDQHGGSRDGGMTMTICAETCLAKNAENMGLQAENCWCGDLYGNYGMKHDAWCRLMCPDDLTKSCGGIGYNAVYSL